MSGQSTSTGKGRDWFGEQRYGMFVHANIATAPAFAPVHEYADWYWAFLETKPDMVLHPTCPLPEVVAWHHEHAAGQAFDEFIDLVVPELQNRGVYKTAYRDGSFRQKLFGDGDRIHGGHPAARYKVQTPIAASA